MSRDTAFKVIEFIYKNLPLEESFALVPWGGEPISRFSLIKEIYETYPQISYNTSTSGELVDEEIYKWFTKVGTNFTLIWSLGNAYEKYGGVKEKLEALPWMARLAKERKFFLNLTQTNPENMFQDFKFLKDEGYGNIAVQQLLGIKYTEKQLTDYSINLTKLLEIYKNEARLGEAPIFPANPLYRNKNVVEKSATWYKEFGPQSMVERDAACRHGLDKLFIDTDGGIWPCEGSHLNQEGKLGDIINGIDWNKVEKLQEIHDARFKRNYEPCLSCNIKEECSHIMCYSLNLAQTKNEFTPYPGFCEFQKMLVGVYRQYIENRKEEVNGKSLC